MNELKLLIEFIKEVDFIKSQFNINQDDLQFVCQNIQYEFSRKGETIIEYNTIGDKFYILIEGIIGILVPFNSSKNNKLTQNFKEVCTKSNGYSFGELSLISNKPR